MGAPLLKARCSGGEGSLARVVRSAHLPPAVEGWPEKVHTPFGLQQPSLSWERIRRPPCGLLHPTETGKLKHCFLRLRFKEASPHGVQSAEPTHRSVRPYRTARSRQSAL